MSLLIYIKNRISINKTFLNVPKQGFCSFRGSALNQYRNRPILRNFVQKRTFFSFFKRPTKQQMLIKDNIPDGFKLIYRNTSDTIFTVAQVFTTFSTFMIAFVIIFKTPDLQNPGSLPFSDQNLFKSRPRETENEMIVYFTVFLGTLLVLQMFIAQMPKRIYYNPSGQKYWIVFNSNIPFMTNKLPLKVGEIRHSPGGLSPWKSQRYELKDGRKLLLLESQFRRPADLYIMMGVQRDPDLDEYEK